MKKLLQGLARPSTFLPVVVLAAMGVGVASQIVAQNTLAIIINGVFIAVATMVAAAYGPALISALRSETQKQDQFLLSGILLIWVAIAGSRIWSLALIMAGKPAWMINHWFPTYCYLCAAMSGFYFLQITASSKRGSKYSTGAAVIAIMIITFLLAFFEA